MNPAILIAAIREYHRLKALTDPLEWDLVNDNTAVFNAASKAQWRLVSLILGGNGDDDCYRTLQESRAVEFEGILYVASFDPEHHDREEFGTVDTHPVMLLSTIPTKNITRIPSLLSNTRRSHR